MADEEGGGGGGVAKRHERSELGIFNVPRSTAAVSSLLRFGDEEEVDLDLSSTAEQV